MISTPVFENNNFLCLPDFGKAFYPCDILNADDNGPLTIMRTLM
jgi:hypothetical protein